MECHQPIFLQTSSVKLRERQDEREGRFFLGPHLGCDFEEGVLRRSVCLRRLWPLPWRRANDFGQADNDAIFIRARLSPRQQTAQHEYP